MICSVFNELGADKLPLTGTASRNPNLKSKTCPLSRLLRDNLTAAVPTSSAWDWEK